MVEISNCFDKNSWCTFTKMLNEKQYKFYIFKVIKNGLQVNIQLSELKRPRKKDTIKKALQTLYGQKDHIPWNTGQEKSSLKTVY